MKIPIPLAFTFILFISACTRSPHGAADAQTQAVKPPTSVQTYRCASGETIAATYTPASNAALVHYKGHDYAMHIAISASGARYVGGDLEWWTKGTGPGSTGILVHHMADGTSGASIENCLAF